MPGESVRPQTDIDTFDRLDIRAGRVVRVEPFPEARKPALKLWVDFGESVGIRVSSAQLTRRYTAESLTGSMVLGVVNFPPRRIAGFASEVLILGVMNPDDGGDVVLVRPGEAGAADIRGWRLA